MRHEKLADILANQITGEWGEEGDDVAVLRTTNFTNEGRLNLSDVVRRSIPEAKILKKRLLLGDTIIEKSGGSPTQPVGRVVYFDINGQDYLCNNFTSILRPSKEVEPRYFFWFLFANHINNRTLKYQNKTTGIINLKLERYLEETKIPLPPLPIQKRIAAILDKADSLRQKDKQLLEHYNKLAQSIFYHMFGNGTKVKGEPSVSIKECCKSDDDIKCGPFGTQLQVHEFRHEGIPLWGIKHVNKDFSIPTVEYLSREKANELKQYNLVAKDLVMTRKGTIGNCAIYPDTLPEGVMHSDLLRIRLDYSIARPIFIACQFRYNKDLIWQLNRISKGAIMAGINVGKLKQLRIPLPKVVKQREFEVAMDKIERSRKVIAENRMKTDTLFQSLLQKAFKGELVKES